MHYRREIDGLRALAVVPVILFHAGFGGFGGGFVGVDVFFVISGYLITSIILAELNAGKFSIVNFYERRARRILPALFLVILCSIPFAWLWLLPNDMQDFSQSVLAVVFFASNVLFWRESGYFDTEAELKPLLHTWSLGAEEQFYLLFPLLVLLAWRGGTRRLVVLIVITAIASLAIAQWGSHAEPAAAFFLLPARGWELAIGALLAVHFFRHPQQDRQSRRDGALAAAGVLLIGVSVAIFDESTPFPGVYALVPTVGTALVIRYAWPGNFVGSILGSKLLVGIGLISYSAYLWHQPVLAFARHRSAVEPGPVLLAALCLLSLALAYLSWRFVEAPFRRKGGIDRKAVFGFAMAGSAALAAFGVAGHVSHGFLAARFPNLSESQRVMLTEARDAPSVDNGECHFRSGTIDPEIERRFEQCHGKHGKAIVLLGDSHAIDLYQAMAADHDMPFIFGLSRGFCRPQTQQVECHYESFLEFARRRQDQIETVFYTQAGAYLVADPLGQPGSKKLFRKAKVPVYQPHEASIDATAQYLSRLGEWVEVVWLGPRLEPHVNIARLTRQSIFCRAEAVEVMPSVISTFESLDRFLQRRFEPPAGFRYVSQLEAIGFDARHDLFDCDSVFWSDGDHWSSTGEQRFGQRLIAGLRKQGLMPARQAR